MAKPSVLKTDEPERVSEFESRAFRHLESKPREVLALIATEMGPSGLRFDSSAFRQFQRTE